MIHGVKVDFEKYPNGYIVGRCDGLSVGSHKNKRNTVSDMREILSR